MNTGISAINEAVQEAAAFVRPLFNELGKVIVGQNYLVERLVIGLLAMCLGYPGALLNQLFDGVIGNQQLMKTQAPLVAGLIALVTARMPVKLDRTAITKLSVPTFNKFV